MATKGEGKKAVTFSSTIVTSERDTHKPQRSISTFTGTAEKPTGLIMLEEKAKLQTLCDRLAAYMDRVRHLEAENSRLTHEVQTTQETVTLEVTSIKSVYENELAHIRKLLDETSQEKANLETDYRRLWEENSHLKLR
jgi:lamin B